MTPERLAQLRHHHERHANFTPAQISELLKHIDGLAGQLEQVRGDLTHYGRHEPRCEVRLTGGVCNCGFEQARKR